MADPHPRAHAPDARVRRFERVEVVDDRPGPGASFAGRAGTVVWCDGPCFNARTGAWAEWAYSVYFTAADRYRSFRESNLRSAGQFDAEGDHLGRRFEVSFDSTPVDDAATVEGCFRLPGSFWQVFLFAKTDVPEPRHRPVTCDSGITGVEFEVPRGVKLDRGYVVRSMEEVFGPGPWAVAAGPDSLILK
jgi:hypothetical protein